MTNRFENARSNAYLVLADGSVFPGKAIGAQSQTVGEVVFNTAMTGYQEILSDPSYAEQIVCFTYPHIGNVGANPEDMEAKQVFAKGLVIRDLSPVASNWRATESLQDFLVTHNLVGIVGVDTRKLTHHLRNVGAQNGAIVTDYTGELPAALINFSGIGGLDLAKDVSTKAPYQLNPTGKYNVVAYDFGVKQNILNLLVAQNCAVTVVPAQTPAAEVLAMHPDGVFLSNGPGDPAACDYAIENAKVFIEAHVPLFGICLGCQILSLALGAKTVKMKFGHHGANHPVKELLTGRVYITSQNHGFAIDEASLPKTVDVTHRSLFDQTIQGIRAGNAFAFQGHPEASPGPHDIEGLFQQFADLMS